MSDAIYTVRFTAIISLAIAIFSSSTMIWGIQMGAYFWGDEIALKPPWQGREFRCYLSEAYSYKVCVAEAPVNPWMVESMVAMDDDIWRGQYKGYYVVISGEIAFDDAKNILADLEIY